MDNGAVVVWFAASDADEGVVRSQWFELIEDAEKFSTTCGNWAVVVFGGLDDFTGSISLRGDYPFPAFGGEV